MSKIEHSLNHIPTEVYHLPENLVLNLSGMQIKIVRFSHVTKTNKPWHIDNHAHLNWEFHFVVSGSGTITTMGKEINVHGRHLYVTPPFLLHEQTTGAEGLEEYCIECNLIPPISPMTEFAGGELLKFFNMRDSAAFKSYVMSEHIQNFLFTLEKLLKEETPSLVLIEGIFLYIISEYLNTIVSTVRKKKISQSEHTPSNQALAIKNYIDANICNQITTQDIADLMFISTRQIDRIFSKKYNMTTFQYLQNLRVKAAVNLIMSSLLPYNKIAEKTGFSSYRQMVRTMHACGYPPPSEIRKNAIISNSLKGSATNE